MQLQVLYNLQKYGLYILLEEKNKISEKHIKENEYINTEIDIISYLLQGIICILSYNMGCDMYMTFVCILRVIQ